MYKMIDLIKAVPLTRRELYVLLILGIFLAIFLKLLIGTSGLIRISIVAAVALGGVLCLFISTVNWKFSFYCFLVSLLLEGILRRWVVPAGLSTPVFFIKHLLLVGPYFYFFTRGVRITKRDYPFLGLVLAYVVWGSFEVLNFRATSDVRVQVLGFITHFWFIPLVFLVPMVFNTEEKILKFFKLVALISIPIFILGVIQYLSSPGSIVNRYPPSALDREQGVAFVGFHVRISGIFSYITPYNTYLGLALPIILYVVLICKPTKYEAPAFYASLLLGVVNLIMTGSRGPVFIFVAQAGLFISVMFLYTGKVRNKKKIISRLALALPALLVVLLFTDTGNEALTSLLDRTMNSGDTMERIMRTYTPLRFLDDAGLGGYGIGTTYQGAMALVSEWGGDMPRDFEEEWGRVLLELGLIGFIVVMLIRAYALWYPWMTFLKVKSYELRLIALLIFVYQLPILMGRNIVFSYLDNIFFWFLMGLLVAVNQIERNNAAKSFGLPSR